MSFSRKVSIYCLKLEHGKYYVGKTTQPIFRIVDHFDGNASEWTCLHKPISLLYIKHDCDNFDEDKYTKMVMARYGINNVRGGSYSRVEISRQQREVLENEIRGANDTCFHCGQAGHFAIECSRNRTYTNNVTCYRCGGKGHYANQCGDESDSFTDDDDNYDDDVICYRCGRPGHYANQCYRR